MPKENEITHPCISTHLWLSMLRAKVLFVRKEGFGMAVRWWGWFSREWRHLTEIKWWSDLSHPARAPNTFRFRFFSCILPIQLHTTHTNTTHPTFAINKWTPSASSLETCTTLPAWPSQACSLFSFHFIPCFASCFHPLCQFNGKQLLFPRANKRAHAVVHKLRVVLEINGRHIHVQHGPYQSYILYFSPLKTIYIARSFQTSARFLNGEVHDASDATFQKLISVKETVIVDFHAEYAFFFWFVNWRDECFRFLALLSCGSIDCHIFLRMYVFNCMVNYLYGFIGGAGLATCWTLLSVMLSSLQAEPPLSVLMLMSAPRPLPNTR